MLYFKILFSIIIYMMVTPLFAQKIVDGTLLDATSGSPIQGAQVSHDVDDSIAITDSLGRFHFSLTRYPEKILVNHLNYREVFFPDSNLQSNFRLMPINNLLSSATTLAFENSSSLMRTPAALGIVKTRAIESGDESSLLAGLNSIPGVKMEERGYGGSRRINIRGSFLRSPFAVRNIKMYWEGIPLTQPDGSSPLELIDPQMLSSVQVIKGPAGSIYGAGNGGVLLFSGVRAPSSQHRLSVESSLSGGSFGYFRSASKLGYNDEKFNGSLFFTKQFTQGYRSQEANEKQQVALTAHFYPNEKLSYHLISTQYDGKWELPGAIKKEDVLDDPTQAQPFSEKGNASVNRDRSWIGISQNWKISKTLENKTSVYAYQTDKVNPYGTSPFFNGWKNEESVGKGGRTIFSWQGFERKRSQLEIKAGGEWQTQVSNQLEWSNNLGNPDAIKYENRTKSELWMAFLSATWQGTRWNIELGSSYNGLLYHSKGITYSEVDIPYRQVLNLGNELLPRWAASFELFKNCWIFASQSNGVSFPSIFEMLDTDSGTLNANLSGERGRNRELGIKLHLFDRKLYFEASGYLFELNNTIVPADNQAFNNLGNTEQQGAEWTVQFNLFDKNDTWIRGVDLTSSGTYNHYYFRNNVDSNLSGKHLTGVPLATVSHAMFIDFNSGFLLTLTHSWYDKAPINDDNSVWAPAYHLLNVKMQWQHESTSLVITLFAGANNLLNTSYSSFLQLNGFGGKFFNPSPGINGFAGLKIALK